MPLSSGGALRRWAIPALVAALSAVGCGPNTGTVTGTVTYNGGPLKGGNVVFTGSDGKQYVSEIAEDGSYTVEKVPPGDAKISVETSSLEAAANARKYSPPPGAAPPGGTTLSDPEKAKARYVKIPSQYEEAQTSGLTCTVTPGKQKHDIPLK